MRVEITSSELPLVGEKITDGKRLMEVEEIDAKGFWLSDAKTPLPGPDDPPPEDWEHVAKLKLIDGTWELVREDEDADAGAGAG